MRAVAVQVSRAWEWKDVDGDSGKTWTGTAEAVVCRVRSSTCGSQSMRKMQCDWCSDGIGLWSTKVEGCPIHKSGCGTVLRRTRALVVTFHVYAEFD